MVIAAIVLAAVLVAAACAVVAKQVAVPRVRAILADIRATRRRAEAAADHGLVAFQLGRGSFDLSPAAQAPTAFPNGSWRRIAGAGTGWPSTSFYKVRGLAPLDGKLYASLTGPRQDGTRGEVWAWDGAQWELVGGGAGSWAAEPAFVDHLTVFDGCLHAAVGRHVWRRQDGRWHQLAAVATHEKAGAYCFASHENRLLVGCWGVPGVYVMDAAGTARRMADPALGWGANARTVYCLASYRGALYAGTGTGRLEGPSSSVFRFDGKEWEKVGGDGIRGSWTEEGIPFVLGFAVFADKLLAVVARRPGTPGPASSVWAFDGEEWRPVAAGQTPAGIAEATILNDVTEYCGRLVVVTGSSSGREARAYALEHGQRWRDISGPAFSPPVSAAKGGYWIYRLAVDGDRLFAGSAGHEGAAGVFEFSPDTGSALAAGQAVGSHQSHYQIPG